MNRIPNVFALVALLIMTLGVAYSAPVQAKETYFDRDQQTREHEHYRESTRERNDHSFTSDGIDTREVSNHIEEINSDINTYLSSVFSGDRARKKINQVVHVPLFIQDVNGQAPSGNDTPLYESRLHNPVMVPDSHHVTLGEFNEVEGTARAYCTSRGVRVTLSLDGLIPNGLYTVWNVTFNEPGFLPASPPDFNIKGVGALGDAEGNDNTFRATRSGRGYISAITRPGPLSLQGNIAQCPLTQETEWHVVGAYHMDDQSHGVSPGPDGTYVEQFAFILTP